MNPWPFLPSWLVAATLQGTFAIVIVWLLSPLIRHWLGARATHWLWLLAVIELLLPWHPPTLLAIVPIREIGPLAKVSSPLVKVEVLEAEATTNISLPPVPPSAVTVTVRWPLGLWIMGSVLVLSLSALRSFRAARIVSRAPDIAGAPGIREVLRSLPNVPRRMRIRETGELKSPALASIWRPTILLPQGWDQILSQEELLCIFSHEIGHICRGDLLWRWLFLLARAVHWFNPLVWLAERSARAEQEMACDEWVSLHSHTFDQRVYGEVLLKVLSFCHPPGLTSPIHAAMAESRHGFKRRIRHLSKVRPHGWISGVITGSLILLLALIIGPAKGDDKTAPITPSPTIPVSSENKASPSQPIQIEIESKFIEFRGKPAQNLLVLPGLGNQPNTAGVMRLEGVFQEKEFQDILRQFSAMKNVDLLSAPRVTTRLAQRAVIEVVREFRFPTAFEPGKKVTSEPHDDSAHPHSASRLIARQPTTPTAFDTRKVGVTLEVEPVRVSGDDIKLNLNLQIVEFLGFVNYGGSTATQKIPAGDTITNLVNATSTTGDVINQPIFSTRRVQTSINIQSGQTILFGGMDSRMDQQIMDDTNGPRSMEEIQMRLLAFVTVRIMPASDKTQPSPDKPPTVVLPTIQSPVSAAPSGGKLPLGAPVPGKPGFVISPYAPDKGYVDLRGFVSGTEVKCPYTGKIFVTP